MNITKNHCNVDLELRTFQVYVIILVINFVSLILTFKFSQIKKKIICKIKMILEYWIIVCDF